MLEQPANQWLEQMPKLEPSSPSPSPSPTRTVNSPSTPTIRELTREPLRRGRRARPDTDRFAALIEVDENGCHIWQGMLANGQGYFKAGPWTEQRTKLAHRFAWEQRHGPLASTQQLTHTCGVRACCNPDHLAFPTPRSAVVPPESLDGYSEREILDLLVRRYTKVSMGAHRYAFAEHVPNQSGYAASRVADFIAVDCFTASYPRMPLRNEIHGREVKVNRSDWLKELRDPSKAEAFRPYCHRWWLVVSNRSIVRAGELPDGWGLIVAAGKYLRAVVSAPLIDALPMPAPMTAALLRATAKTARSYPTQRQKLDDERQ